ncbi:hypothetical protein L208DRAFT_1323430 [Tricholoma matsutake]|nr:hypothetical protein L208DRAFT_1323430 [Tricholoma matsutake 945]
MGDKFDAQSFAPALPEEESTTKDESVVESDMTPRPKKQKAQAKDIREAEVKPVGGKVAAKRKQVDKDEEIVPASDDELIPRLKKVKKVPVCDEIDMAAKKMVENEVKGNKYSGMVKTMFSKPAGEHQGQKPALGAPSQLQAVGCKVLKREGAIADISALYKKATPTNPDQTQYALKHSQSEMEDINDVINASQEKQKHSSKINEWAAAIPATAKPTFQGSRSTSSRAKSDIPSLTSGASCLSAPSVLTDDVKIISYRASNMVKVKGEPVPELSMYDDGGFSDNDEIRGEEQEVAINSPPKGRKRVTSEQLIVQKPSKSGEMTSKKPRNEELPSWIEPQWFRHTFVTTYMAFVGQTTDPWDVPVKQSVKVMQKIWDETSSYQYEITTSTSVYQKTVQCLADSWHNVVGSTGIAVLLAFLDAQEDLRDSDEECIEFAKYYLEDLRFLYKDTEHDNKKKWKGLFCSPFILQTFTAHLTAIEGSAKVPNLHDKPTPTAIGGLGLATASVERGLTLIATGTLTVTMARASKGKMVTLPWTLNLSSGKDSMRQTGFSEMAWGKATCCYATSACSLANTKFDAIIREAREFMKPIRSRGKTTEPTEVINIDDCDDERACLVNNSGSDEECKSSLFSSMTSLTIIDCSESMMRLTVPHNLLQNSTLVSPYYVLALPPCQIQLWLIMLTLRLEVAFHGFLYFLMYA